MGGLFGISNPLWSEGGGGRDFSLAPAQNKCLPSQAGFESRWAPSNAGDCSFNATQVLRPLI